ncbi:hypothetical protein GS421_10105 [Rhodococcus hoagii]|nr:hypothetical protein [Prescottella equi]
MQVKMGWARPRRAVIGAAALLSAGLVACGSDDDKGSDAETTAAATTRTFQAQNGAIEIPGDPQSIVACGYAVLPLIQSGANLSGICEWGRETTTWTPTPGRPTTTCRRSAPTARSAS